MSTFKHKLYYETAKFFHQIKCLFLTALHMLILCYNYPEINSLKAGNPVNFCIIFIRQSQREASTTVLEKKKKSVVGLSVVGCLSVCCSLLSWSKFEIGQLQILPYSRDV